LVGDESFAGSGVVGKSEVVRLPVRPQLASEDGLVDFDESKEVLLSSCHDVGLLLKWYVF